MRDPSPCVHMASCGTQAVGLGDRTRSVRGHMLEWTAPVGRVGGPGKRDEPRSSPPTPKDALDLARADGPGSVASFKMDEFLIFLEDHTSEDSKTGSLGAFLAKNDFILISIGRHWALHSLALWRFRGLLLGVSFRIFSRWPPASHVLDPIPSHKPQAGWHQTQVRSTVQ